MKAANAAAAPHRDAAPAARRRCWSRALGFGQWLSGTVCWSGLVLGTPFFAFSLTPSLLPRSALMQGLVSGFSLAAGYALGVLGRAIWRYLELPAASRISTIASTYPAFPGDRCESRSCRMRATRSRSARRAWRIGRPIGSRGRAGRT